MFLSIVSICAGASLGALLRWVLALQLNAHSTTVPPGTLTANWLGGYLIGIAVAWFASHPAVPPQWRLFVITGFLGGLTTFSTFSAEVVQQLMQGRVGGSLLMVGLHVIGSVVMTLLGMGTVALLRGA